MFGASLIPPEGHSGETDGSETGIAMAVATALTSKFGQGKSRSIRQLLPQLVLTGWVAALVLAQSTGRLEPGRAFFLLAFPIVAVGVALRPAWVVLFFAAVPLVQIPIAPTRALVLLLFVTLIGQLVMRGDVSVGWRSGFLGLIVLIVTAFFFRANLTGDTALIARGVWNNLAFLVLLGLVSSNATRIGDLRGKHLVNAILFGLTLSVIIEHTLLSSSASILGSGNAPVGRPIAYIAAAGFALCYARLVIRTGDEGYYHRAVHILLASGFVLAMMPGLVRGAWLSALVAVFLISLWAGKRRYWVVILLALAVMLTVPIARDRVVPSEQQAAGGGFTTGRVDLWIHLWDNGIEPALPWGNGFGYTLTISSEDLFGPGSTSFGSAGATTFVYPHNDLIFWMVDLGLLGLAGVLLFWGQLIRAFRSVSRSTRGNQVNVRLLSGVLITGAIVQLVGSVFLFTALAVPFFAAAGFVLGAREAATERSVGDFLNHSSLMERSMTS
jgi:hypothetical protein